MSGDYRQHWETKDYQEVPEGCPHCGSQEGYYFVIVERYTQAYDWEGYPIGASDAFPAKGNSPIPRCSNCGKSVNKVVKLPAIAEQPTNTQGKKQA